jgi:predicted DNA-binding antitoxin AbrB/MazE fold protein
MLSINAIYENGQITLLEKIPSVKRAKVIITILEEDKQTQQDTDISLFDDIVGAVSCHTDGSINHDKYITKNVTT